MKENTENYILQSSMHMRWLKVTQTPLKELKLKYASVFRYSTANDPQTGGHPQPQIIPAVDRKWSRTPEMFFGSSFQFLI